MILADVALSKQPGASHAPYVPPHARAHRALVTAYRMLAVIDDPEAVLAIQRESETTGSVPTPSSEVT